MFLESIVQIISIVLKLIKKKKTELINQFASTQAQFTGKIKLV